MFGFDQKNQMKATWRREGKTDKKVKIQKEVREVEDSVLISYKNKFGEKKFKIVKKNNLFFEEIQMKQKPQVKPKTKAQGKESSGKQTDLDDYLKKIYANKKDIIFVLPFDGKGDSPHPITIKPHGSATSVGIDFLKYDSNGKIVWKVINKNNEKNEKTDKPDKGEKYVEKSYDKLDQYEQQLALIWIKENLDKAFND